MADSEVAIANNALGNIGSFGASIDSFKDDSKEARLLKLQFPLQRDKLLRDHRWNWAKRRAYLTQLGGDVYSAATAYGKGAYVSYRPAVGNVVNMPELASSFVYVSIVANNLGNQPDISPAAWCQVSRAQWAYAFKMPSDIIFVRGIYRARCSNPSESDKVVYDIENEPAPDADGNAVGPGKLLLTNHGACWNGISTPAAIELIYTARITDVSQFPPDFEEALAWRLAEKLALEILKDPKIADEARKTARDEYNRAVAKDNSETHKPPAPVPSHIRARGSSRGGHRR